MPYNPQLPLPDQIKVSMTSSLHSFQTHSADDAEADPSHLPYVDCLVLHSQLPTLAETLSAWQTMESLTPHYARHLGISNTSLTTLQYLCAAARIKPAVVQNRFYAPTRYDVPLRKFCVEKGIVYQAFWTLTANPGLLASKPVASLVETSGVSREVGLYCFVLGLENVVVLNGTTSVERMKGDLEGVEKVREWIESEAGGDQWEEWMREFKALIGEL
ncbi:hypothetical protein MMC30_007363 [Trapelia coarctata]|nr:hypothetical protein [Trapelia coarctata]